MDKRYDAVIVGTGAAGLYAALNFPESVSVLLISKRELPLSNSSLAQGGVACVLDTVHDNYKLHINDTLVAGKYKNTLSAVEKLVKEGPADVLRTKDLGVDYDLNPDGTMCKTLEAGHSRHRIVHHKDSTGKAIVDALIEQVRKLPNVDILENALLYSMHKTLGGFYLSVLTTACSRQAASAGYINTPQTPLSQRATESRSRTCSARKSVTSRAFSSTPQRLPQRLTASAF